jgi:hypothetical protein
MIWGNTPQKPLFLATLTLVASRETHQQMLEIRLRSARMFLRATINRERSIEKK